MGQNRKDGGRSPGFIESTTAAIDDFYSTVVQQIVPWTAKPPQARAATRPADKVTEPIEDTEDLHEAIGAARATAAGQTDITSPGDDKAAGDNLVDAPIRTDEAEASPSE
jgi:hypothetical protein